MIEEALRIASKHELICGEEVSTFQDLVERRDWIKWAKLPEERPLVPDTLIYKYKPFISLNALIP